MKSRRSGCRKIRSFRLSCDTGWGKLFTAEVSDAKHSTERVQWLY
jgi:hypothetical protein